MHQPVNDSTSWKERERQDIQSPRTQQRKTYKEKYSKILYDTLGGTTTGLWRMSTEKERLNIPKRFVHERASENISLYSKEFTHFVSSTSLLNSQNGRGKWNRCCFIISFIRKT